MLVTNLYQSTIVLIHVKHNINYLMWYNFDKICRPCNEYVKGLLDILNFLHCKRDFNVTVINFLNIDPYHIICINNVVYGRPPITYVSQGHQRVQLLPCTYNPIVSITLASCSSLDALTAFSTLLPFVLTCAHNTCISMSIKGVYCDPLWGNSILMASFNSYFILSRVRLFSSSISFLISSLRLTIISFLHSSLRLPIILDNCCWLMDVEEVLEPCDALP